MAKATIVYIIDPETNEVLMARKVRKVGTGFWFGYGGKIEPGQTPQECTIEETLEESGGIIRLSEAELEPVALIEFYKGEHTVPKADAPLFSVLFYRALKTKASVGEPLTTDEMADPTWFPIDSLPWDEIMPGDELLLPQVLAGTPIKGWVHFTSDEKGVIGSSIENCSVGDLTI
ncbi:MAG: NUDIX domain-containing protein [Minisyncoccia bacterium]